MESICNFKSLDSALINSDLVQIDESFWQKTLLNGEGLDYECISENGFVTFCGNAERLFWNKDHNGFYVEPLKISSRIKVLSPSGSGDIINIIIHFRRNDVNSLWEFDAFTDNIDSRDANNILAFMNQFNSLRRRSVLEKALSKSGFDIVS